jgi:hypothetical protein
MWPAGSSVATSHFVVFIGKSSFAVLGRGVLISVLD